ncbi:hypothetical protein Tco_1581166, partial [Tanacetum coccineum]
MTIPSLINSPTNTKDIQNPELSSLAENNSISSSVQFYSICTTSTHVPNQNWNFQQSEGILASIKKLEAIRIRLAIVTYINFKASQSTKKNMSRILPAESQRNSTDPSVDVIDSSETEYDSVAKSSVCSTFFPPVEKPGDAELVYGPKTVKTTLKS